ncbi:unnamed protein product [Heterobilharzia americana]|nr:unnamed protein product [Heterobilharzia americana]
MLSTNQFIELPLIASYSNAFLETIAEETSELETSENGTFNNDIFDMDKISFCTDNDIKICDIDLSNQLSGLKQDNNNNNNDNNSNNNQISLDNFENLNEYLSKNFISSSNTLYKVKQTEFSSDNLENNQQPSTKLKLFQQQLYNSWTLNLPVKLDDKKEINSFENQLYTDLGNSTNSGLTKNGFLKDVNNNNNNNNNNSTSQYTNSVNTDGFVELTEDSKENHKKIINTIKQNKSQKEFTLPLWNDEAIDEELLILSTDYNRNQLCWTLTPSYATMNSSLSQCKTNEDVKY